MDRTRAPFSSGGAAADYAALGINMTPTANRRLDITGAATDTTLISFLNADYTGTSTYTMLGMTQSDLSGTLTNANLTTYVQKVDFQSTKTLARTSAGITTLTQYGMLFTMNLDNVLSPNAGAPAKSANNTVYGQDFIVGIDAVDASASANTVAGIGQHVDFHSNLPAGFNKASGTDTFNLRAGSFGVGLDDSAATAGTINLVQLTGVEATALLTRGAADPVTYSAATLYGLYSVATVSGGSAVGTVYGVYIHSTNGGGTTNWGFYNASACNNFLGLDNSKTYFGTGSDACLYYNASDLVVNPDVVGTGRLIIDTGTAVGQEAVMIQQDDQDQAFINFQGTSAADLTKNISTFTTEGGTVGYFKIEINGAAYWVRACTAPTA